jgi:hypothetical protein
MGLAEANFASAAIHCSVPRTSLPRPPHTYATQGIYVLASFHGGGDEGEGGRSGREGKVLGKEEEVGIGGPGDMHGLATSVRTGLLKNHTRTGRQGRKEGR